MNDKKPSRYILNSVGEPVTESDLLTWAKAFKNSDRKVKQEHVGPFLVSTVFLGLDHNFSEGPPILWETMVFLKDPRGRQVRIDQDRCSGSSEQALAMHAAMVERIASIRIIKEE
jgi:hypothetical protein